MKSFFDTFLYFFRTYPRNTGLVVTLLVLAGLAEAFGIMVFLPFLQIVLEGASTTGSNLLQPLLDRLGVAATFPTFAGLLFGAIAVKSVILWISMHYVSKSVAMIARDFRLEYMKGLLSANWRYFTRNAIGSNLNTVMMESFRSSMAFLMATRFLASIIQFTVYAVSALFVSWEVFAGGIVIGGALAFALISFVKAARKAGVTQTQTEKLMLAQLADMLQDIKSLKAMALESKYVEFLNAHSKTLEAAQYRQLITRHGIKIFHEPLMVLSIILGIYMIMSYTNLAVSELALLGILFIRMLTSLNAAQVEFHSMAVQESALNALKDAVQKTQEEREIWPGNAPAPGAINAVGFSNLSFAHDNKSIFENSNLEFASPGLNALMGPSGSGKSTALDLLCAFYKPDQGEITVNGENLLDLELSGWRRMIGFVPQDIFLFNDTIRENIIAGRDGVSDEQVYAALEAAGAKAFIDELPDGINAMAGEKGRLLSGGQRQRIAIARAIIHRPQILLLDEATSALDAPTEEKIFSTLKNLSRNMIVICATHNPRIQDYADAVYSLQGNRFERMYYRRKAS